jgi:hypothetical protein
VTAKVTIATSKERGRRTVTSSCPGRYFKELEQRLKKGIKSNQTPNMEHGPHFLQPCDFMLPCTQAAKPISTKPKVEVKIFTLPILDENLER